MIYLSVISTGKVITPEKTFYRLVRWDLRWRIYIKKKHIFWLCPKINTLWD